MVGDLVSGTATDSAYMCVIGNRDDNLRNWKGNIDFVVVYNRTLSADEVAWLAAEPYAMFTRPDRWRRVFDFGESGGIIRPRGPRTLRVGPRMILGGVI